MNILLQICRLERMRAAEYRPLNFGPKQRKPKVTRKTLERDGQMSLPFPPKGKVQ